MFIGYGNQQEDSNPVKKYQLVLMATGKILEDGHFLPKKIDDHFSIQAFDHFFERLDGNKHIFLKKDIEDLSLHKTRLDDELHGARLLFFTEVNSIYLTRIGQLEAYSNEILAKPFDFSIKDSISLDTEKNRYATDSVEQKINWTKYLKLLTVERYSELLELHKQKNHKGSDDAVLEKEARDKVKKVIDRYFERIKRPQSEQERFSTLINVFTNLMDPHTDYFPPVEKRAFDERLSRKFFGIGALLSEEDGKTRITSVSPGGPAWKTGEVHAGDVIVKVGQGNEEAVDISGYALEDAIKLIRGDKDTEVRLNIRKADGASKEVIIKRGELKMEEAFVRSAVIQGSQKIGYIHVPDFYADFSKPDGAKCSVDVARELARLKAEKVDAIIIDVRDNGGGSLHEAVQMVGLFIPSGPVVQVKDRNGKPAVLYDEDKSVVYDGPLAVMVNEFSASASEIFAAAIQDYKRGIVIGSTSTYGKGTVQQGIPLNRLFVQPSDDDLGTIHLTIQKYYRVNGGSTQLKGVIPDLILPGYLEHYKVREKDMPSALAWDKLAQVPYNTWGESAELKHLLSSSQQRISKSGVFDSIKHHAVWLSSASEKPVQLQLSEYVRNQNNTSQLIKRVRDMMRLTDSIPLRLTTMEEAGLKNSTDTTKLARNNLYLKQLSTDIYLGETVNIVHDMITMRKLVKK